MLGSLLEIYFNFTNLDRKYKKFTFFSGYKGFYTAALLDDSVVASAFDIFASFALLKSCRTVYISLTISVLT